MHTPSRPPEPTEPQPLRGPSPMVSEFGLPAGAPLMPWGRYILSFFGFPVRHPDAPPSPPRRG